jgi:NAD(P)-dependent dehydrogenase (short-subunit alcohol dehydrogenase family)
MRLFYKLSGARRALKSGTTYAIPRGRCQKTPRQPAAAFFKFARMTNTKPLEGKVAIVAGSSRGAGRGIAAMLGEGGATVYCTGRSEAVHETARMATERGGIGIAVRTDHTVAEQVGALLERVSSEQNRLDVLVNNVNGDDLYEWKPFWKQSMENGFQCMQRGINSHLLTIHTSLP